MSGISELMQARYRGDLETVERLRANGHELTVHEAAAVGDVARLGALLDADPRVVDAWSPDGAQPLHFAAFFGHVDAVRLLLARGADASRHARGFNEVAPINSAAANDAKPNAVCTEIVRLLLDAGADPGAAQGGGATALDTARFTHNAELERLLVDAQLARLERPLRFDDVGDPAGTPVLYFHGGGDSRLSRHPDDQIAAALGVRLLAVDRCGPAVRGRTLVSWAHDVEALADALGLKQFAVVGWSAGGPHALAAAAVLPDRVTRAVLVGSMPPPDGVGALPRDVQRTIRIARLSPWLAAKALERWGRRPPPATGTPDTDEAYARGRVESFRDGGMWLARELACLARPWDFDLADVTVPVSLWCGDGDRVCPPSISRDYEQRLPNAKLTLVEGTHQLLFARWRDILADAAGAGV